MAGGVTHAVLEVATALGASNPARRVPADALREYISWRVTTSACMHHALYTAQRKGKNPAIHYVLFVSGHQYKGDMADRLRLCVDLFLK